MLAWPKPLKGTSDNSSFAAVLVTAMDGVDTYPQF